MMNIADFEDLLNRLGDDLPNWPAPQQEAADLLLQSSEQARRLLDESRLLRHALAAPPVRASAALTERIMQAVRAPQPADPEAAATPPNGDPQQS